MDAAFSALSWCEGSHAFAESITADSASRLRNRNSTTFAHLELHDITLQLAAGLIALGTRLQLSQTALRPTPDTVVDAGLDSSSGSNWIGLGRWDLA
jgi:hypothetical protein